MADYYPLLARALDALPDRSPALRSAVYARARAALIGQLRSLDPPLSEADIDLERNALDTAIARLEADYGGAPDPLADPAPTPAHQAIDGSPAPPAPAPPPFLPPPAPPADMEAPPVALPPAPPPDLGPPPPRRAPPPPPEPVAASVQIQPRQSKAAKGKPAASEPASVVGNDPAPLDPDLSALPADAAGGGRRPRIAVVKPRGERSRLLRNVFVGGVLAVVIGLIAIAAFLLRDRPADLQPGSAETQAAPPEGAESKFADRVGGEAPAAERPTPAPSAPAPIPAQPDVSVAQRAIYYEENASVANGQPVTSQGRAVWRLDAVNGEQGQQLETVARATVDFPDAGLTLAMTMRRNLDATLPASHVIELSFTNSGAQGAKRAVQDVGLLQLKDEEGARGSPLSGLPVRVRENLFLIGLSSLRNDVDRNTDMLLHKNWFDLAIKLTSGPRAIVTFEKGNSGAQVLQSAFDQWK